MSPDVSSALGPRIVAAAYTTGSHGIQKSGKATLYGDAIQVISQCDQYRRTTFDQRKCVVNIYFTSYNLINRKITACTTLRNC